MDFEKNFLEIENEDDIFNLDEENKSSLGEETFRGKENFNVNENNIDLKEENEFYSLKKVVKEEKKEKKIQSPSHVFGTFVSVLSSVLIIGTSAGLIPSLLSVNVSNIILRSTELGFEVNKDPNKIYLMSLYNDDYKEEIELSDESKYIYTDLNPSTVYNLDLYDITDGNNKKLYSANYLTKARDEFSANITNSSVIDDKLFLNVEYEGENIDFVTVDVLYNGESILLYEGLPKNEFIVDLKEDVFDIKFEIYINGEMTCYSTLKNEEDEEIPSEDDPKEEQTSIPVQSISLDKTNINLKVGEDYTLTATVYPLDATDKTLIWESSDENIVTVADGKVMAVAEGSATITAMTADGTISTSCSVTVEANVIPVESISLDKTSISLNVGEDYTLTVTVYPLDATDKAVEWRSFDESIATVVDGKVTAVSVGSTTIVVETPDGEIYAGCTVDVTEIISVESVSLSESEITLVIGETKAITATVLPENATNKALRWSISGTDVATVEDGLVTAVGVGRTILIVSSNDGGKYKTCVINVTDGSVPIQSISLNESTINMEIGESETLEATVLPENATDKSVTWTSEDPTIATIEDGVVTAVAEGHTTIIATGSDGITWAGCSVYVTDPNPSVKSVSLNESTLEIDLGENSTLTATVMPYNAVDKSVIWESSDTDVATVANGVITAVGVGETTIKVTTVDGGFTATCIVTVVDNSIHVTGVSFENDTESIEQNKTITLVPIIAPTNATNTNVTWESSDTDVATVNSNGVVTGVMPGEATITVTTEDGSFTATCVITVTAIEPTFSNFFMESNKTNSGNEIITFILGYEDPSLVWKNKFIVECLRKIDGEVLFKDYVTPSSKKYAALNSKNRYMLLEWKDSYLEALSDPEVITYTINVYAESDDQETLIYTDDIYSANCFSTGKNPIPGSIILKGTVNDSGQVKPQFQISSDELSGIDKIGVIFSYPATGEAVCTIQNVTLNATITADINLPSGSTPYIVTVYGYIDSEPVTVISEKITISNN